MQDSARQTLGKIREEAKEQYGRLTGQLQAERSAVDAGNPTPTHASGGRSALELITDRKKNEALRIVIATVALEGRDATFGRLGLTDCFQAHSRDIRCATRLRLADVFPDLPAIDGFDVETDLKAKGVRFKARRMAPPLADRAKPLCVDRTASSGR
jgi:hypothetical protein